MTVAIRAIPDLGEGGLRATTQRVTVPSPIGAAMPAGTVFAMKGGNVNAAAAQSSIRSRLDEATVESAMHPGVVSCSIEASVREVAALMAMNRVHCIVGFGDVTENDTRLWGVISDLDLVSLAAADDADAHTAAGIAATEVVTVSVTDTLRRAATLMAEHGVSHVLVVDGVGDRPVGVLSTLDIARELARA